MVRRKLEDPDPQNKSNMNWYYDQGGERQGPVDDATLDQLIATGVVRSETLVWCEGMPNWAPLSQARPAGGGAAVPEGYIRCTATGRYFPPSEIVYIDGKPYSAEAKASVVQGVMQGGQLPTLNDGMRNGPAWERRSELGFLKALWETIKTVLLDPARTFSTMKRDGGLGAPLGFFMILTCVGMIVSLLYQLVIQVGSFSMMPRDPNMPSLDGMGIGMIILLFVFYFVVVVPILSLIGAFIYSGILHLSLMVCSGARQDYETTFRTYCYTSGAGMALLVVPFCGPYIGGIWALVCLCIGLAKTHEIGTGRAVCAALLPTVVCCVIAAIAIFAMLGIVAGSQGFKH
jgi:hypothetical protein